MKRLPLLLLAVGCWISVGVHASPPYEGPPPAGPPGGGFGHGKRSAEEEADCLLDCKKDHPKLSIQACLQKCKITKRSHEKLSAQDPPPQPWQVNGPGKRSAEQPRNYSDIQEEKRRYYEQERLDYERYNCTLGCRRMSEEFSRSLCLERCNNITKRSTEVSAQDPPPQPWQVNGPGKRSAEDGTCWTNCRSRGDNDETCAGECGPSGEHKIDRRSAEQYWPSASNFSDLPYEEDNGIRPNCTLDCQRHWHFDRSFCLEVCNNITKRSAEVSAQDPPPQPWQVNGPGKRSAEKLSAQDPPPQPWQVNGPGKRSVEEQGSYNCYARCMAQVHNENCSRYCSPGKRSAQDPPPQPWQVNGPGKRSIEKTRGL